MLRIGLVVLLLAGTAEAANICAALCRCACRQQTECRVRGTWTRRAEKACRLECRLLNAFCGDLCTVGSILLTAECRAGESTSYCINNLEDVGC